MKSYILLLHALSLHAENCNAPEEAVKCVNSCESNYINCVKEGFYLFKFWVLDLSQYKICYFITHVFPDQRFAMMILVANRNAIEIWLHVKEFKKIIFVLL